MTDGAAAALRQRFDNFRALRVIFHGVRIGLRVGKNQAIFCDHGNACAARSDTLGPALQRGYFFGLFRRQRSKFGRICLCNAGDGRELFKTGALIIALQRAIRKKIHCQQYAEQQDKKSQREF